MVKVELRKEIAEMVKDLAMEQGMTEDEVVHKIIKWFVEDCNKEI